MEKEPVTTRDLLALERTKLANERTLLAYFRTSLGLMGTGLAILKIEAFSEIRLFGFVLVTISPIVFVIGLIRNFSVRKTITKRFK